MTRERGRDVMRVRERQRAQRVIESEASCKGFYFDPLRIQFQMTPYRENNNNNNNNNKTMLWIQNGAI